MGQEQKRGEGWENYSLDRKVKIGGCIMELSEGMSWSSFITADEVGRDTVEAKPKERMIFHPSLHLSAKF